MAFVRMTDCIAEVVVRISIVWVNLQAFRTGEFEKVNWHEHDYLDVTICDINGWIILKSQLRPQDWIANNRYLEVRYDRKRD